MDLGLRDAPILVAGSSRGIGLAVAEALLAEGAQVMITGRDEVALEEAASSLGTDHGPDRVASFAGDLSDPEAGLAAVAAITDLWGPPTGAVLNVGSGTARPGWELGSEEWDAVFRTNLWASVRTAEAVLPSMVEARRGALVFIGSIVGLESVKAPLSYSAAKAALHAYVRDLARELGPAGVRANAVVPGNVVFPGGSWARKLEADPARWQDYVRAEVPLQRFGTPEDVAAPVAFLLSERAAFVTGTCLVADGGQTRSLAG